MSDRSRFRRHWLQCRPSSPAGAPSSLSTLSTGSARAEVPACAGMPRARRHASGPRASVPMDRPSAAWSLHDGVEIYSQKTVFIAGWWRARQLQPTRTHAPARTVASLGSGHLSASPVLLQRTKARHYFENSACSRMSREEAPTRATNLPATCAAQPPRARSAAPPSGWRAECQSNTVEWQ